MKKLLLASAVAALSVTAANAAPTVYGKAFLTIDASSSETEVAGNTTKNTNRPALKSNSSRIGLKGSEALTSNTDLLYQLEYGVNIDDGRKGQFTSRDTYLGLANAQFGTFKAGRLTSIDDEVEFAGVTQGGVIGGNGVLAPGGDRINNAITYASPDYNGMKIFAMYGLDEGGSDRELAGLAGTYEQGPMRVGASYLRYAGGVNYARISGGYDINQAMSVGALYQLADYKTDNKESALAIGGEMKIATPWIAYAQGDMLNNAGGIKDASELRLAVGGKYTFNKNTLGHVYGAVKRDKVDLPQGQGKSETTAFGVGGGIEYKF